MASDLDRHILVITEPTIKLDPMNYDSGGEEKENGKKISKSNGNITPAVRINNIDIQEYDLNSMTIDTSGLLPTLSLAFMDSDNQFKGDSIPRDGDVVSIRLASRQSDTYKDIRMDFDIINCNASSSDEGGANPQALAGGQYSIRGRLKVPKIFAEESKGYGRKTSLDHLEQIATELQLGFATNIDKTDDEMSRFCPFISKVQFINDIIKHGYIDDESFVVGKIDPYYNLNYVDLNKVFNSKNDLELTYFNKMQEDTNKNPEDNDDTNKIKATMLLTNHPTYNSSSQFFENFKVINESGAKTAKFGYTMKLQYFENDSDEGLVSFDVEPRASKTMSDIEEPLRGRRADGSGKEEDTRYKDEVKQKFVGRIDADKEHGNMNINHYSAAIINKMNYAQSTKMKLEIMLDQINPGLYMFQKIPVFVTSYNDTEVYRQNALKEKKKEKGFSTVGEEYGEDPAAPGGDKIVMDEFHTGYYIIENIQYLYDSEDGLGIRQKLTLLRREWPSKLNAITAESMEDQKPPAPAPSPAPTPSPAPAPAPAPSPEPAKSDVPLDLQITMNGGTIEQDVQSPYASQNKYVTINGNWKANKEVAAFDSWSAEIDGTSLDSGNGMTLKKDGRIIIDGSDGLGRLDPGEYTVNVTVKAEGKTFNGTTKITVVDAKTSEFTYDIVTLGPKKGIRVYKSGALIHTGNQLIGVTEDDLKRTAILNLENSYPGVDKMQKQ